MTCPQCSHPRVKLSDGTETCTWSEAYRNECEAMHVCSLPTLQDRRRYLTFIYNRRGKDAWLKLRDAVELVWKARHAQPAVASNTGS